MTEHFELLSPDDKCRSWTIYNKDGLSVYAAFVPVHDSSSKAHRENAERRAKLFVAAPDLLEACKVASSWLGPIRENDGIPGGYYEAINNVISVINAAIAKAEDKT